MCFHGHLWVACLPCVSLWHLCAVPRLVCVYKGISVQHVRPCVLVDESAGSLWVCVFAHASVCSLWVSVCFCLRSQLCAVWLYLPGHLCTVCQPACACLVISLQSVSLHIMYLLRHLFAMCQFVSVCTAQPSLYCVGLCAFEYTSPCGLITQPVCLQPRSLCVYIDNCMQSVSLCFGMGISQYAVPQPVWTCMHIFV